MKPQAAAPGCTAAHPWTLMLGVALGTVALALAATLAVPSASAAPPSPPPFHAAQLARRLHRGGYVLVLRHAQSPETPPSAQAAEPDNPRHERQLSDIGKANARALGDALHTLGIPIGPIYSSPTYRALETVRLAGLAPPQPVEQLTEGPRGMRGSAGRAQVRWLQRAVARVPPAGTNALIVTHTPNIVGAFGPAVANIQAGEMLVFRPPGHRAGETRDRPAGRAQLIGRLTIEQWQRLAPSAR